MYLPRQLDGDLAPRRPFVVGMNDDWKPNFAFGDGRPKMTKLIVLVSAATLSLGVQLQCAVADEVPNYDVRKSCKLDTQAYPSAQSNTGCLADEQNARTTLVSQWTQFAPESRSRCTQMVSDPAGPQSYVELLTCLQMAKDVKSLPKN